MWNVKLKSTLNFNYSYLISYLKQIGIAFLVFTICRLLFFLFNLSNFNEPVPFAVFIYGIRFDYLAVAYLFVPFTFFALLPVSFKYKKGYQLVLKSSFHLGNTLGILLNLIDVGYFQYSLKRSTADLFQFLGTGNDVLVLLPQYMVDYWYLFLILIALIGFSEWLFNKSKHELKTEPFTLKTRGIQLLFLLLFSALTVVGFRGGIQFKPIDIINAANYATAKNIPIVLNTPFSIIKTVLNDQLKLLNYFEESQLVSIYNPETTIKPTIKPNKKNVVIVILESFAKEYVGFFNNGKGYTPFLDSLMNESYVFTNAYSSGNRSIESLPSIFAGIPPLMNTPYIISNYSANKIDALPAILKTAGYNTSFYHGGNNGTMGFSGFTATAGIDEYYGKNEYPHKNDDDGAWGIADEPYLNYFSAELTKKKTPFFSTIFTLSSHHPFQVPEKYKNTFAEGELPIHKTISYTDFALKQFFEISKKMDWFKNTIFVFTSDHSSTTLNPTYSTFIGNNAIPIFIYDASGTLKGKNNNYFQHTDITPTVLSLLGINTSIVSFGSDAFFDNKKHFVGFARNTYFLAQDSLILLYDGEKSSGLFDLSTDSLMLNNKIDSLNFVNQKNTLETKLKAILQQYNNRLINNKTSLTTTK